MIDRETYTLWTQLGGEAYDGDLTGAQLEIIPMPQMTWEEWKQSNPDTVVLSPDKSFEEYY